MKGGGREVNNNASVRQLAVAAFTGLLTPAAAVAGLDWRGAVLAFPVILLFSWCWGGLGKKPGGWTLGWTKGAGRYLAALYFLWSVLTAGTVLAEAGGRMSGPDGRDAGWVIVLAWIPVLFLARKGTAAYGRAAEIFYLGMLATLVFVLALGGRQIKPDRLLGEVDGLWASFSTAVGIGCTGAASLVLWNGGEDGRTSQWMGWSGLLTGVILLMRVVTMGVLGPALARGQERPFFIMAVGLGQTARVEGLVESVWLLADITLAGLMLQCGKKMWSAIGCVRRGDGAWIVALLALCVGLWQNNNGNARLWLTEVLPAAGLLLGGIIPLCARLHEAIALEQKSEECQRKNENKKS